MRSTQVCIYLFICLCHMMHGQKLYDPEVQIWKPMKDGVYLQEVGQKIKTTSPVQSIALVNGRCFGLIDGLINELENDQFHEIKEAPINMNRIISIHYVISFYSFICIVQIFLSIL